MIFTVFMYLSVYCILFSFLFYCLYVYFSSFIMLFMSHSVDFFSFLFVLLVFCFSRNYKKYGVVCLHRIYDSDISVYFLNILL